MDKVIDKKRKAALESLKAKELKAIELYMKARGEFGNDESFQILMNKDKRTAGEHLLRVSTLLQLAGNHLINAHREEKTLYG